MTVEFKVHAGGNEQFDCVMEDMDLCYVSKFMVDGVIIYSVTPKGCDLKARMEIDDKSLEAYGYYMVAGSIK